MVIFSLTIYTLLVVVLTQWYTEEKVKFIFMEALKEIFADKNSISNNSVSHIKKDLS